MAPAQRAAYQRALSVDAKPLGVEGMGGGIAGRRNVPCPTLIKQEVMEAPIRAGPMANGFPGGMGGCPPRGGGGSKHKHACDTDVKVRLQMVSSMY